MEAIAQHIEVDIHSTPQRLGIGISGTHRSGKTTLARALALANGFSFEESTARNVASEMGIDINSDVPFARWLDFHEELLRRFEAEYRNKPGLFVTDRTPLDFAAYLTARVPPAMTDKYLIARYKCFLDRCFEVCNEIFMTLLIIPPVLIYEEAEGKPVSNYAHQQAIHLLIQGMAMDERIVRQAAIMSEEVINPVDRIKWAAHMSEEALNEIYTEVKTLPRC